jgi:ribonucleoside-diphosphate reductase alpha chain
MKDIIDMSRQRGYFVDQSQSLNLFMENANFSKLTSMHFYAWQSGLKTGMYYLRTKSAVDAIKFTLNNDKKVEEVPEIVAAPKPVAVAAAEEVQPIPASEFQAMLERSRTADPEDCEMCGS